MKTLPCEGYKSWGDCGYRSDIECGDCVCAGGDFDPRYDYNKQPKKLSKYVLYTKEKARR